MAFKPVNDLLLILEGVPQKILSSTNYSNRLPPPRMERRTGGEYERIIESKEWEDEDRERFGVGLDDVQMSATHGAPYHLVCLARESNGI